MTKAGIALAVRSICGEDVVVRVDPEHTIVTDGPETSLVKFGAIGDFATLANALGVPREAVRMSLLTEHVFVPSENRVKPDYSMKITIDITPDAEWSPT